MKILDPSHGGKFHIWLNGIDVSHLTTFAIVPDEASCEGPGTLTMLTEDSRGQLIVDPETHELIVIERSGMVRWKHLPDKDNPA